MGETTVVLNSNSTTGSAVAVYQDGSSREHQEVIIQTQASSSDPVSVSTSNPLPVGGNVASGNADSGNPVKGGGVYRATPPSLTDGQRGDLQLDTNANLKVSIQNGVNPAQSKYSGAVTALTLVSSAACTLFAWDLYNPAANSAESYVQFFDASSTGAVTLGTTAPAFSKGLAPAGGGDSSSVAAGVKFSSGIVIAATTTRAGATGASNAVAVDLAYT